MNTHATSCRRAFTLIDVLVTVVVMAIIAALALPGMSTATQINLTGLATTIASDLEFTQSLSLANPQNPALLKFDTTASSYWIAFASDPDDPIIRPGTTSEPYRITFGQGNAAAYAGVILDITTLVDNSVVFDSYGRLLTATSVSIGLFATDGRARALVIDSNTGFVSIQ